MGLKTFLKNRLGAFKGGLHNLANSSGVREEQVSPVRKFLHLLRFKFEEAKPEIRVVQDNDFILFSKSNLKGESVLNVGIAVTIVLFLFLVIYTICKCIKQ